MASKRFLKFRYAAIRRYGEKQWTAKAGMIEFCATYVVSCGYCEKSGFGYGLDHPYIVEMSNGTKFLCYLHNYGEGREDEIMSERGEVANELAGEECYELAEQNLHKLNSY